jgi:hypothetical protein
MALSRVGVTEGSGSGTSASTSLPGSTAAADLAYTGVSINSGASIAIDQSYVEASESPQDDGFVLAKGAAFRKVLVGSDVAPAYPFGSSTNFAWWLGAWRGVHSTTPVQDEQASVQTNFQASVVFPSATAGGNTVWSLLFAAIEGTWDFATDPAGWTRIEGIINGPGFGLWENQTPGTGTISPANATLDQNKNEAVFHFLIREDDGAPAPTGGITLIDWRLFPKSFMRRKLL